METNETIRENQIVYSRPGRIRHRRYTKKKKWNFRFILSEIDKPFLVIVMVLLSFGLIMMFSASYAWGISDFGDGYYYIKKQMISAGLGVVIMMAVSFLDYHFFVSSRVAIGALLGMVAINIYTGLFGFEIAGARRWIMIGSINFQPSELLKIAFIMMFAYLVAHNYDMFEKSWKNCIIPFAVVMGLVFGVLVLQRHMSAVMLVAIIGLSMMFVSGMPKKTFWKFIIVCGVLGTLYLVYKITAGSGFSYITDRIESWRNPTSDPGDATYQTYESLLAIGSGGWFGLGFGESRQKYMYLPESQNDFVFSIVCEELGIVGAMVVVLLFALFILRGFYIASRCRDKAGMLLAAGITIQIGSQAFFNIMVACNAFPNTGISLPFFSYGGTALLIQLAEMGILLNISRQASRLKEKPKEDDDDDDEEEDIPETEPVIVQE